MYYFNKHQLIVPILFKHTYKTVYILYKKQSQVLYLISYV